MQRCINDLEVLQDLKWSKEDSIMFRKENLSVSFFSFLNTLWIVKSWETDKFSKWPRRESDNPFLRHSMYLWSYCVWINSYLTQGDPCHQKFRQILLRTLIAQFWGISDFTYSGFTLLPFVGIFKISVSSWLQNVISGMHNKRKI